MNIFTVYSKSSEINDLTNAIYIKEGASYWGIIFGILLLAYRKLWKPFCLMGLACLVVFFLSTMGMFTKGFTDFSYFIIHLYIALTANDWTQKQLRDSGYQLIDVVFATDEDEAKYKFLERSAAEAQLNEIKRQEDQNYSAIV